MAYLGLSGRDKLRKFQMKPFPISKEIILVVLVKYVPMARRLVVILGFLGFWYGRTALSSKCLCYFCLLISRRGNMVPGILGENILIVLGNVKHVDLESSQKHVLTVR